MNGATDGGAHIEAMRTGHMKRGRCSLCGKYVGHLERHHEKYRPEHVITLCHNCHHRVHFRPYHLSDREKEKLLACRHGSAQCRALRKRPGMYEKMMKEYVAPGRRAAQLEMRRKLKAGVALCNK